MSEFLSGPDFYDNPDIFDVYMNHRLNRPETPNDTMEGPVIHDLMGDVRGKSILDLGCGDGMFGQMLLAMGCKSYFGVDGSANMIAKAKINLATSAAQIEHATLEDWSYPVSEFDMVFARLVLHYIDDVEALFNRISDSMTTGGTLIFSVEHPVITSSEKRWQGKGQRQDWLVDDYFRGGRRENSWLGGKVVKYHRTIEQYFSALQRTGFEVNALREATPIRENFKSRERFLRRQRIPLFLIMSASKTDRR